MTDVSQLSDAELFSALPKTPENFTAQFAPVAARVGEKLGVDPSILLGQWGHETGWGKSVIPGTNNLGNIKGPGVAATDNMTGSRDTYAAYQSPDEFGDAYANLIQSRYPGAVGAGNDVAKFTGGLKGYAEDPAYPQRLSDARKSIPERLLSAIIPSAYAQERPADVSQMSNEDLARAAGVDLSQVSNEDLAKSAGVQLPQQPAQPPALTGNQLLMRQLGIAPTTTPLTDRQKAAGAVYGALEGGPLNEFTHGIASGAANLVGGAAQLAGHGIGAGLNALDFPNAGAAVSGAGDSVARYLNQGTPDSVVGQVGQAVGSAALPAAGGGVVRGIVGGAAGGAAQPVLDGQDYWSQKAQQAGIGAAVGGAAGVLGKVIGGANVSPNVQRLLDAGVTPTPGQVLGGTEKSLEERATSIPIVGDAIASGQRSSIRDMNRALYQDVLDPIGERAPTTVGRDSIDAVGDRLSDRYNNLLPNVTFHVDNQFMQDMNGVAQTVNSLPQDLQNRFASTVDRNLFSQLQNGQMGGVELKKVESILGREASNFRSSPDAFQRDLGQAIGDVQTAVRQSLLRSNPQHAQELQAINGAYSRFAILRNAAARVNDPSKPIMPGQLQAAVKQADKSVGKGAFARGNARGQGMSDAAMEVLGSKYPDSGTAGRVLLGSGVLSGGGIFPHIGLPAAAIGLPIAALYGTNLGRQAMLAALVRRPGVVRQIGQGISNASPLAGVAGAGLLSGTSGQ